MELKLAEVQRRFWEAHRAELTYDDEVVETIAARCTEVESGARNVDHILSHHVLPELSSLVLERMTRGAPLGAVHLSLDASGGFAFGPAPIAVPAIYA